MPKKVQFLFLVSGCMRFSVCNPDIHNIQTISDPFTVHVLLLLEDCSKILLSVLKNINSITCSIYNII